MNKIIRKKCLSIVLTLAMVMSLFPAVTLPAKAFDAPTALRVLWLEGGGTDQSDTCHNLGDYITNVTFAGIDNTTPETPDGWHHDYGRTTPQIAAGEVTQGQTYPFSITVAGTELPYHYLAVYIDWNGDNENGTSTPYVLDDNENPYVHYGDSGAGPKTYTGTITVPANAQTGLIYMRVMLDADSGGAIGGDFTCGVGYGEFEDYVLNVSAAGPSITTQPNNATVNAGSSTSFTVAATGATGYQWQVNTGSGFENVTNGGVYSNATTATLNITGATAGMNGYQYRAVVSGSAEPAAISDAVTLAVNSAPTDISLSATSVNENVAGNTTVGTLSSTDPDAGNTFTYTLVAGDGSTDNAAFNISGSSLRITDSPDYETKNSYSVRVRTTDQGGLWYEEAFTITINDLNESPTVTNSTKTVDEDTTMSFAATDFTGNYNDPETAVLSAVKIETLPDAGHGKLQLSGADITAAQVVNAVDIGNITFVPALNFSGNTTFTWKASDGTDYSVSAATMTLSVTGVNDAPSFTKGTDKTVLEDGGAQSFAGWATALSAGPADESGQTLSFTVSNDNNTLFCAQPAIASNGTLTFTPAANASGTATVTVTLHDDGGTANGGADASASQTFTISITSLNDAPSFTKGTDKTVLEDGGAQSFAGWATALSAGPADESGQTLSFTVSNDNNALFSAQPAIASNGTLTFTPAVNANGTATVTVTLHDDGGTANGGADTSASQTFTITITSLNDVPSFTKGTDKTVLEDCGAQSFAVWATSISAGPADESGQTLSFAVSNDNNALFSAQPAIASNGTLTFTPAANANGTATVTVTLHDDGGTVNGGADESASQTFTITVTSVNDAPSVTNSTKTLDEDTTLTFSAADFTTNYSDVESAALSAVRIETLPDAGHGKLQLSGADVTVAQVVNAADLGNITFVPALNFSGNATFTWKASDGTDYSASAATMTLSVTGINETPTDIALSSDSVSESAGVGTTVGNLSTTDPDAGDTFNYTLIAGDGSADNASFLIVGNELKTNTTFSYATKNSYSIRVKTADAGGLILEKVFVINITEVNQNPTDIVLSPTSINENLGANSTVGTLSTTDVNATDTFTYTLVSGDGSTDNASFNILGNDLRMTGSANFEANSSYSVRIRTTDAGGLWYEEAFAITISDLNEAPTDITLSASAVNENVAGNTTVGTLSSADPDSGNTFTYTLVSGDGDTDNASFNISGNSLRISSSPNYETKSSYSVRIGTTDQGGLTIEQTFTITINNLNEAPTITTGAAVSVTEGSTAAFTAAATDPEGSAVTWSITGGADQTKFSIVAGAGVVTFVTAPAFGSPTDADTNNTYVLEITASDGGVTATQTVTVTVIKQPSSGGSNTTAPPTNTVVEVNGQKQDAGTSSTQTTGGQTVTTIKVDDTKLDKILASSGEKPTVTLPTNQASDVVVGELNGQTVKNMEAKEAVLEIKTGSVSYTLPAAQINIDDVSSQLGEQVALKDIKVSVMIAEPPADTVKIVENTAAKNSYQIVVKPVEFEITCTSGDKTVVVSKFNGYVERTVAIPDGIDPSKITTGIVLNSDGTFSHVPTQILVISGKYYAKINSLTNSTYSVIYNPTTFADVSSHWAKDAVNDMGARMVVTGIGNSTYEPERSITRAEFAAIVVRALGLRQGTEESGFGDVARTDWFNGYVDTATEYGLITGYDSKNFGPDDTITREQAMAIIARAMKLTGMDVTLTDSEAAALLSRYTDSAQVSAYAKESAAICLKEGIVKGTTTSTISPKSFVTRAEVSVMVQRLLQESGLI